MDEGGVQNVLHDIARNYAGVETTEELTRLTYDPKRAPSGLVWSKFRKNYKNYKKSELICMLYGENLHGFKLIQEVNALREWLAENREEIRELKARIKSLTENQEN